MIALVDCNNFFASCERLFRPDLKNKPVLVLSNNDGCVVARSNEVKELGIPMGVPYFKVRDIIEKNNVQCFSSNFQLYSSMSQRILGVLNRHTPTIEVYSIDEAFLDLSQLTKQDLKLWGNSLVTEIQKDIGMPVSVGIAPTKTLAKLANNFAKAHKTTTVLDPKNQPDVYNSVLKETPVGHIWGVGWRREPELKKFGIKTAYQLAGVSEAWIKSKMGIVGVRMLNELRGIAMHPFEEEKQQQKSLMVSRSFGHTIKNTHDLESAVATFASQAAYRLRKNQQVTSYFGVYLKYKVEDGQRKNQSASVRFSVPTNNTPELVRAALELMYKMYDDELGYKKAGVFAGQLSSSNICQVDLFDVISPKTRARQKSLMQAVDSINQRYGNEAIHIGSISPGSTKWHALKKRMSPAYTTDWNKLPLVYPVK